MASGGRVQWITQVFVHGADRPARTGAREDAGNQRGGREGLTATRRRSENWATFGDGQRGILVGYL